MSKKRINNPKFIRRYFMKKTKSLVNLALILCLLTQTVPTFASTKDKGSSTTEVILEQHEEIKGYDQLHSLAKKGDASLGFKGKIKKLPLKVKDLETGKENECETVSATQLLKKVKKGDAIETYYSTTLLATAASYTKTDSVQDDMKITATIYWSETSVNGVDCIDYTRISGKISDRTTGVAVYGGGSENQVYGSTPAYGGSVIKQQSYNNLLSYSTFDFDLNFEPIVSTDGVWGVIGSDVTADYTRGGSYLSLTLPIRYELN